MFFRMRVAPPNLAGRDFAAVEDPEDRLGFYLRTMYNVQQDGEPHAIPQLHGLLWSVMGELLTAAAGAGTGSPEHPWVVRAGPPPRMNTLLARFDAMVARHLADPPSVPELASRLALSASRLTHRLQAEGGTTAVSRIRWLRIREARRLLGMGLGVKEVASMLGFSSPAVFARVFRAIVGLTPQEYRRRLPPSGSAVVQTPC